jgi:uncharacterized protein (DUF2126 family)
MEKEEGLMAGPYGRNIAPDMDEKEIYQHIRAIDKLVNELGVPAEVVNQSYQEILTDLRKDVKMSAFLPVLVSRCVKGRLMRS